MQTLPLNCLGLQGKLTEEGARMVAPRWYMLLAVTSLTFSGCAAALQDFHYTVVNKTRAEYAWLKCTSMADRWNAGSDFAHGYKSGFYDASTGKGCVTPALPPPCYWSTKYQSCEGQQQIQCWYRGYQSGVAAAQGYGYPSFHSAPLGPEAPTLNQNGCGACYGPTGCLCEHESTGGNQGVEAQLAQASPPMTTATPVGSYAPQLGASLNLGLNLGLIGPTGSSFEMPATEVRLAPSVRTASAEQVGSSLPIVR